MKRKDVIIQDERIYKYDCTETFFLDGEPWEKDIYLLRGTTERGRALMFYRKLDGKDENVVAENDEKPRAITDSIRDAIQPFEG